MVKSRKSIAIIVILTLIFAFFSVSTVAHADSSDVSGINSGTVYYLKNVYFEKYLQVKNGTDANGTDVWTNTFSNSGSFKWRINRNNDGTYRLHAFGSSSGRVLDITGDNVDIWTYNSTYTCQKFTLIRDTSMTDGGCYRIKYGDKYVVATASTVKLSQYGTGDDSLWSLEPVSKGEASLLPFLYSGFDTTGPASVFVSDCYNMGYAAAYFVNATSGNAYTWMNTDAIWVFDGHGAEINGTPCAALAFLTSSGNTEGYITALSNPSSLSGNVYKIPSKANNAMAKAMCVLYIGCSTGVFYQGSNLVSEAFEKGAHFALGTTQPIYTDMSKDWIQDFFDKANTGATIRQCLDYANYRTHLGLLYYEGDVYAKLK